ncbi:MAG: hypothetical protein JWP00_4289 [Chloroflexi bacterium]|jgi:uncharacterized protein YaaQ|nr:hypothetical protein [Chloroflexota bacterium]
MAMKLVVAIVQNEDADDLIDGLTAAHYGATRLASTGGFLRQGNTTIIVGVPDEAVQNVLTIVAQHSQSRRHPVTNPFPDSTSISSRKSGNPLDQFINQAISGSSPEIQTGRATVFVLNLDRYERV